MKNACTFVTDRPFRLVTLKMFLHLQTLREVWANTNCRNIHISGFEKKAGLNQEGIETNGSWSNRMDRGTFSIHYNYSSH